MATHTTDPCETTLPQALNYASTAADTSGLPQTVYRGPFSMGWWHTNPFAKCLLGTQMAQSVLPQHYFC